MPSSVRPKIAQAVVRLIATPAPVSPSIGDRSENRKATRPIWAKKPSAKDIDNVTKRRSRHMAAPDANGGENSAATFEDELVDDGVSPSGVCPSEAGLAAR